MSASLRITTWPCSTMTSSRHPHENHTSALQPHAPLGPARRAHMNAIVRHNVQNDANVAVWAHWRMCSQKCFRAKASSPLVSAGGGVLQNGARLVCRGRGKARRVVCANVLSGHHRSATLWSCKLCQYQRKHDLLTVDGQNFAPPK